MKEYTLLPQSDQRLILEAHFIFYYYLQHQLWYRERHREQQSFLYSGLPARPWQVANSSVVNCLPSQIFTNRGRHYTVQQQSHSTACKHDEPQITSLRPCFFIFIFCSSPRHIVTDKWLFPPPASAIQSDWSGRSYSIDKNGGYKEFWTVVFVPPPHTHTHTHPP